MEVPISVEGVFGGAILLAVLMLIIGGKLRLPREVEAKDEIVAIKNEVIEEQQDTIVELRAAVTTLIPQNETMLTVLQEIRDAARQQGRHP